MKKRMFLSTILMTLVLLVAVTTATFAWYTATTKGATVVSTDTSSIKSATQTVDLGAITATITLKDASNNVKLTDVRGHSYYYAGDPTVEANKKKLSLTQATWADRYGSVEVTITLSVEANVDLAEAVAQLEKTNPDWSQTLTFSIAEQGSKFRLLGTKEPQAPTKLEDLDAGDPRLSEVATTLVINVNTLKAAIAGEYTLGKVYFAITGTDGTVDDSGSITGTIKVS